MNLTSRDRKTLDGVHPHLVRVVERAAELTPVKFRVFEGRRSVEKQRENVRKGVSSTMNSRHIVGGNGVCHAVDLVLDFDVDGDGDIDGSDYWANPGSPQGAQAWRRLETAMKTAAAEFGVPIEWGGDWRSFKDYPHWQLPWKSYPADKPVGGTLSKPKDPGSFGARYLEADHRSGATVREYQEKLRKLGYTLKVTGLVDDRTDHVFRIVQKQNGLVIDGILGPRTRTAIDAMLAAHRRGEVAGFEAVYDTALPPDVAEPIEPETEQAAAKKQAVVAGGGALAGVSLAADGLDQLRVAAQHGQDVFTPGSIAFVVFGLVVVGILAFTAYRTLRRSGVV